MPITSKQKFTIAAKDSFDYPLVGLAAFIAGYGQLTTPIRRSARDGRAMAGEWAWSMPIKPSAT